ncbi:hypothetical protein I4U23_001456 [Adineta vaga]|nr:hypothetical protein I4U23_001456 [Adineta vaga]
MLTSKKQKKFCISCGKTAGVFICPGCSKTFCLQHTNEHRHDLDEQFYELLDIHDRFKQNSTDEHRRMIMGQIDRWEQESIEKIHKTANTIRHDLFNLNREQTDTIDESLATLTKQLRKAQDEGNYFEKDLKQWTEKLSRLQNLFIKHQKVQMEEMDTIIPFIRTIVLTEKAFDDMGGRKHNIHQSLNAYGEYSWGNHRIRFILDQYDPTRSRIFIGIISQTTADYAHPRWQNDMETDDVIQLIIDCDQRMIRLINERTKRSYDIYVDVRYCPFPWQPYVRLYTPL